MRALSLSHKPRGTTQVERQQQEIDRRRSRRGVWGPAWGPPRKFEGWSTKGGRALARQMAEPEPIIVRMVEAPSPHHYSQFAANIIEPSYSELIHDRRVLDLLPVIEDQTFDPFWDGYGSLEFEHMPPGVRAMVESGRRTLQRRHGT